MFQAYSEHTRLDALSVRASFWPASRQRPRLARNSDRMPDQRILITGVNGFIAGHLAERLLREGVHVRGTARRPDCGGLAAQQGVEIVQADLMDSRRAGPRGRGVQCDRPRGGVDRRAGAQRRRPATRSTSTAPRTCWPPRRSSGVERFIYISSVAVYGLQPLAGHRRDARRRPGSARPIRTARSSPRRWSRRRAALMSSSARRRPTARAAARGRSARSRTSRQAGSCCSGRTGAGHARLHRQRGGRAAAGAGPAEGPRRDVQPVRRPGGHLPRVLPGLRPHARAVTRCPPCPARCVAGPVWAGAQVLRRLLGRPSAGPWSLHFRFNPSQFSVEKAKRLLGYRPKVTFEEGMRRTEAWLRAEGHIA